MTAELAVNAVKNTALNVKDTEGILLHSDLGSQYTSQTFKQYVKIYCNTYIDFKQARQALFEYIESWYNRKRSHSALGYLTPQEGENIELLVA